MTATAARPAAVYTYVGRNPPTKPWSMICLRVRGTMSFPAAETRASPTEDRTPSRNCGVAASPRRRMLIAPSALASTSGIIALPPDQTRGTWAPRRR